MSARVLFVAAKSTPQGYGREYYDFDFALDFIGLRARRTMMNLAIPSLAGATPEEYDIAVADEYVSPIDFDQPCDVVAFTSNTGNSTRVYEIAHEFRRRGRHTVLGGIHASMLPQEAAEHVDTVVVGEGELIWPRVLSDIAAGRAQKIYHAEPPTDLDAIPMPRYDVLGIEDYFARMHQTQRGCPFKCEFCTVSVMSGRKVRHKSIDRTLREVLSIPRVSALSNRFNHILFVDDNFFGNRKFARELVKHMLPSRNRGRLPGWTTQISIDIADDQAFLHQMYRAGCRTVVIGFESLDENVLNHMNKRINRNVDFARAVDNIHRAGINVYGSFMFGYDEDDTGVFERTVEFIESTGILFPLFSIMTPYPGTALFDRLEDEGRLLHTDWRQYDSRHVVYQPKNMTADELLTGYLWVLRRIASAESVRRRVSLRWPIELERGKPRDHVAARLAFLGLTARSLHRLDRTMLSILGQTHYRMWRKDDFGSISQAIRFLDFHDFVRSIDERSLRDDLKRRIEAWRRAQEPPNARRAAAAEGVTGPPPLPGHA